MNEEKLHKDEEIDLNRSTMFRYISLVLLFISPIISEGYPCGTPVQSCPTTEQSWKKRASSFLCSKQHLYYVCIFYKEQLIEACMINFPVLNIAGGCPLVSSCDERGPILSHHTDYIPCPKTAAGCPGKDHGGYNITQLYKFPFCVGGNVSEIVRVSTTPGPDQHSRNKTLALIIILTILAGTFILVVCAVCIYYYNRRKRKHRSTERTDNAETIPFDPSANGDNGDETAVHMSTITEEDEEAPASFSTEDTSDFCSAIDQSRGLPENLKEAIKTKDPAALEGYFNAWEKEHVSIGITGPSCVGKSSFINTMLGLESGKRGAAEVGIGDTTVEPKEYQHPRNKNLRFWDLPGFGTQQFSPNTYLEDIKVDQYDFFLIMYSTTITVMDITIIKELIRKDKPFALVRTKIDEAVKNRSKTVQEWINAVHEKGIEELEKSKINTDLVKIFAISNTDITVGEYGALFEFIVGNMPPLKKTSILASVTFQTEKIIDEKEALLKARVRNVSLVMGVLTGLPVPGINVALNVALLKKEIMFYIETFQLREENIAKLSPEFRKRLRLSLEIAQSGLNPFINAKCALIASMAIAEGAIELCLPVLGSFITGTTSFVASYKFLHYVIQELAKDAKVIRIAEIESVL